MKKVRKLTPATLKRIIAEEKYNMLLEEQKEASAEKNTQTYEKILSLLNEQKIKKSRQIAYIDRVRRLVKQKISKKGR